TAASAQWHDREWLESTKPESITLTDLTEEWSTQLVTGPNSRAIIEDAAEGFDPDLPWLTRQNATIAGKEVTLLRVSFAGELGWEVHSQVADTSDVYDAVMAAGEAHSLKPFGMFALDALRLEKGYRIWKGDLSTDYTVLQGGLGRFIKWDKANFRGKAALENERQQGSAKRFATFVVEAGAFDAPTMSPIWKGNQVVGETTSGGWGHRVDKSIALGVVNTDLAEPGEVLEIEMYGKRYPATVQADQPLWDPRNERIRA
ncbi:MAG: aminomethyltransferase family protein, partial [Pseudomonadota bacterium]